MAKSREVIQGIISKGKKILQRMAPPLFDLVNDVVMPDDSEINREAVAGRIVSLFKEAREWRNKSLKGRLLFDNPLDFWKKCRKLEEGMHWEVWDKRQVEGEEWRHELVDNQIGNDVRARKANLTANWHDIKISPNVQNIAEIVDQERKKTHWGGNMIDFVHKGLVEGTSIAKSILDRTEDPDGLACEVIVDSASVFRTPYATSFRKIDGCLYVIYATMQPEEQVFETYKGLDRQKVTNIRNDIARDISTESSMKEGMTYKSTKLVDVLEFWGDDGELVKIPFEPQAFQQKLVGIENGVQPEVNKDDNHPEHIKGYLDYLHQLDDNGAPQGLQAINEHDVKSMVAVDAIEKHQQFLDAREEAGLEPGKARKYPYGRKIVVVGTQWAEDVPNPYDIDWRRTWHQWDVERLQGHVWGRGVAEIEWKSNYTLDLFESRIADYTVTVGNPKPWLHEEDRKTIEKDGYDNDVRKPAYYKRNPPVFPQGIAPREAMEIYTLTKQDAQKQGGINDLTYGDAGSQNDSGIKVETLLNQNRIIITGEANQRLNDVIEDMIETRLAMYRKFYKEPRWYHVGGDLQPISVSDILSTRQVQDPQTGEMVTKKIPEFQVTAKPNSNFPNQFEMDLSLFLQLFSAVPSPDPLIPKEAVLNLLQTRYPDLAPGGKYYQMSQALQVGMQTIAAQQQAAKEKQDLENKTLRGVASKYINAGVKQITEGTPGQPAEAAAPSNGAAQ